MSGSTRGSTMRDTTAALGRLLRRQPLGAAGGVIVLVLIAVAVLAPRLAPHGPKEAGFAPYLAPSAEFPMGTDQLGRDMLSRVIWGARLSLYVGLVSVVFGITAGSLWGAVTAYLGGVADTGSQRVVDSVMALPPIILALALMAALGQSVNNAIVVEASLSFIGAGAPPDEPSWGGMLTAGIQAIETAPWMIFFPGLAISLAVFGLNLFGDSIRDVTDPRLRGGLG